MEEEWSDFRRGLRRPDKPHFDRLFEQVRDYADAAGYQNHTDPELSVLISVLLAQERRIAELEDRLEEEA